MSSKPDDPASNEGAAAEPTAEPAKPTIDESDNEDGEEVEGEEAAPATTKKKKKSKRKRIKTAVGLGGDATEDDKRKGIEKAMGGLSNDQIQELLLSNPALAAQLNESAGGSSGGSVVEQIKRLKVSF
jgi:glycylpeptide N-tetradecanoyltransferase